MLHRIIGVGGSGKTTEIINRIKEHISAKRQCYVIVPEQQSVAYEKMLSRLLGDGFNMYCEVLNFERLPNRIARVYGGLTAKHTDAGTRNVLLSLAASRVKDTLTEYAGVWDDKDFISQLGTLISGLKMRVITPQILLEAAERVTSVRLQNKLRDIAAVYGEYVRLLPEQVFDLNDSLTRLALREETGEFFKNTCVFIDSYYTYTPQETEIIKIILNNAAHTYISFLAGDDIDLYGETLSCADKIKAFVREYDDLVLTKNLRANDGVIEYLQDNLWNPSAVQYIGNTENVKIYAASDILTEGACVSSIIHSLIRSGYRYRDITVITGSAEKYDGILDTVLASDGIPCYMSVKDELATKPVVAYIMSALEAVCTDFAPASMSRHIKNSFCPLTVKERDLISRYTDMWNIRGKRWYDGNDWMMNPEGYRAGMSEYSARVLVQVNRAREKLTARLLPFYETLKSKDLTVRSGIEAMYALLISSEADKRLLARARTLLYTGKERESEILSQVWNTLIDIFDKLADVCGDEKTTPSQLYKYLSLMVASRKVGAIPPVKDAVTVGNASLIRPEDCKVCILMGVTDGEFPAAGIKHPLFDRTEGEDMEKAGIELFLPFFRKQNEERFYFTCAVSAPSDKLFVTYPAATVGGDMLRPSVAVGRIKQLTGVKELFFPDSETDMLYCASAAKRAYSGIKNPYIKKQLEFLWDEDGNIPPLCDENAFVDLGVSDISLTPSRADAYTSCPFSFFARYLLKLREDKKISFAAPEIGTFIHSILEDFVSARTRSGSFIPLEKGDADMEVNRLTDTYIMSVAGENAEDKRFSFAVKRFKKILSLVIQNISAEFSQSMFCPNGFEVKIGMGDLPAVEVPTENGRVYLRGIVDRTDSYTKDGKTYLRVIDYKSGDKAFSLSKVEKGLDLQMLMYLFAVCAADKSGNTLPAGVLYMPVNLPQLDEKKEYENPEEAAVQSIKKSGLVLADAEIIRAMDAGGGGVFIPAKLNKDGSVSAAGTSAKSLEEFEELETKLKKTVADMGKRLISGDMCISPLKEGDINACRYCAYKQFCRKK